MSILNQMWENLLDSVKVSPEYEKIDSSSGNLSVEEARKIALQVKEEQEWFALDRLIVNLYRKTENNKLIWIAEYYLESMPEPYIGYQASVHIDDDTAEVIKKSCVLR